MNRKNIVLCVLAILLLLNACSTNPGKETDSGEKTPAAESKETVTVRETEENTADAFTETEDLTERIIGTWRYHDDDDENDKISFFADGTYLSSYLGGRTKGEWEITENQLTLFGYETVTIRVIEVDEEKLVIEYFMGEKEILYTSETTVSRGSYTLGECQEETGLFIRYPDGSFANYFTGYVLTWNVHAMTYGADYFPEDLVMSDVDKERNKERLDGGELVLFYPHTNRVQKGLYPVRESGYSLFRLDDDYPREAYRLEGLILTRGTTDGRSFTQWNQNQVFYWSNTIEYTTINGIPAEDYDGFPSAEGRDFASFPAHETYVIGTVEGTTLTEKQYESDYMYFLHEDESCEFGLTATTDGYAVFDFSNTPPGEYVFTISYWDEDAGGRRVKTAYFDLTE